MRADPELFAVEGVPTDYFVYRRGGSVGARGLLFWLFYYVKINKFEFSGSFRTPSRSAHKNYISITGECRWRNMHLEFRGMQWFFCGEGGCVVRMFISGISLILM